jgi:hypothetical protein
MFYITIHDETGACIDTDEHPMTEAQLDAELARFEAISIPGTFGRSFFRDGNIIVSYIGAAE